ncbi:MAG: S24 family peptidase [Candidatus Solibacter usitatus]|nr:S24 family peptidase [Candidatus Solibacter usitatus]
MIATTLARYSVVEAALPGETPVAAGVIVYQPGTRDFALRFRRDWEQWAGDESEVLEHLAADFETKMREMGAGEWLAHCEDFLSHAIRITDRREVLSQDLQATASRLYREHVRPAVLPFRTHLPLYSASVAAGKFLEDNEVEAGEWVETPASLRLDERMFLARITGRSMEPRIPDGSICVFRAGVTGSRQGKLLLVERQDLSESGGRYTVKRYRSEKKASGEEWAHQRITLEPLNPDFESWDLDSEDRFRIIGEFVLVLESTD